ncbi:substrate-binding domain-containing protein [Thiomicrorhabdus xiamenensis]|uniref:Substrate-binding domain-containing protein n=1 Tax=Thiomicrorhabdus xiamenensis TaxID=2739063 RepID=A0A7D4SIN7_9GAMM|nr:substrate-binding domain-containing protein [Thiomicrorhabdus xiamenensis]QKI89860.1 substrate-binding domain-containing protein [Thiomicrorhabdus xiamenensis]
MKRFSHLFYAILTIILFNPLNLAQANPGAEEHSDSDKAPKLAYLVSDIHIPFWEIMSRGIQEQARTLGYQLEIYSAHNEAKRELKNTLQAIKQNVSGIIVSPTNSSACVTILEFARKAGIPVVISDIGTESGDYVSYISSDNFQGAYQIGQVLTEKMHALGWQNGSVGIIAIPQSRENGKSRTAGFLKALEEAGIKGGGLKQQITFSYQETYDYSIELIKQTPDLKAIWLQGSNRYRGALDAIRDSGREGEILLLTFDAEPEFLELIPQGVLIGSAMQQPFLMGATAVSVLDNFLHGKKVEKEIKLSVLPISTANIDKMQSTIERNVLGILK